MHVYLSLLVNLLLFVFLSCNSVYSKSTEINIVYAYDSSAVNKTTVGYELFRSVGLTNDKIKIATVMAVSSTSFDVVVDLPVYEKNYYYLAALHSDGSTSPLSPPYEFKTRVRPKIVSVFPAKSTDIISLKAISFNFTVTDTSQVARYNFYQQCADNTTTFLGSTTNATVTEFNTFIVLCNGYNKFYFVIDKKDGSKITSNSLEYAN